MSPDPHPSSNPIPAVIYCRVSSPQQKIQGHGLESQESRCREYAKRKGYDVEAVFPDDITGGGDFMKRPGMVALLSYIDAQTQKSFTVIFDDLKRFARDTEFHIQLRRAFQSRGARVECLNFKFEDTPEGKFTETIFAAQGELEREQNRRQTCQKMRERIKRGYWVFKAPVGYTYETVPPHGKLLVRREPLASILREALEGFACGRFAIQAEVQRFLEDQPEFSKQNGGVHPQRVTELLTRSIYAGFVEYAPWGISLRKGHHEPLISAKTFEAIQARRAGAKRLPTRADLHKDFVLRGAVCCADCSVPYKSAWSQGKRKKYAYYVCQTKGCESYGKSIPRDRVEGDFADMLRGLTPSQALYGAATAMFRDLWDARLSRVQETQATLRQQLKAAEAKSQKLLDRIIESETPQLAARLEAKFNELELSKAVIEEKLNCAGQPGRPFAESLEHALAFLANPWKIWEKGAFEVRRTILKLVLTAPWPYHRKTGPRTPQIAFPFNALGGNDAGNFSLVPPHGLEPRTY
ncbi:MAG: recombinase family protein [Rhodobacteraceae bacterium]|nr:recombinase family protein [Paracoccaceae bacterium]